MKGPQPRYVVISPVRDEEQFIAGTIECMARQTCPPAEWVIVNDGSTDRTPEILARYEREFDWIRVVNRENRGFRAAGSGVMEAFYAGLEALRCEDWSYLVKLDGDLTFDDAYFAGCLEQFARDPQLGIGGGVILNELGGELRLEKHPVFHVRGATKIYRRECWDQLGGLIKLPGWDTLDEVKANMLGWTTSSFADLQLVQKRFTGDAAGQWGNWVKNGRASYICGYHPLFLVAKSAARARRKPFLTATFGLLRGYFGAMLGRVPQIEDRPLIDYLRKQQMRRLFGLKSIWA